MNETNTRLPVDLSDEAWQAAEGGREEGCADSSSVAPLYTLLCRPLALWTSLAVTDEVPGILWDFGFGFVSCTSLKTTNSHGNYILCVKKIHVFISLSSTFLLS